jgi:hypothetical protein
MCRNAAEELQRTLQARNKRLAALVVGELHVRIARVSQLSGERAQRRDAAPENHEIDLQLLARRRLEAHDRRRRHHRPDRPDEFFELRNAAGVAFGADLAQQHRRRQADRSGGLDPRLQDRLEVVQFG